MSQKTIPLGLRVTEDLFGMTIIAEENYVATVYAVLKDGEISFPRINKTLPLNKGDFLFAYEQDDEIYDIFQMFSEALSGDTLIELVKRYRTKTLPGSLEYIRNLKENN